MSVTVTPERLRVLHEAHLIEQAGLTPEMAKRAAAGARMKSTPTVMPGVRDVWWEYRYDTPELVEAQVVLRWRVPLTKDEQQAAMDAALGHRR